MLPIADSPETIDISTPPSSERSRSQRAGGTSLTEAVAMMPQNSGFSHRGVLPSATREGGPNVHGTGSSGLRVFNQMNVNHDQRVIIDQQHFVQNNKVFIQTHDPAYTEMLEQTAEARHRMAIAEAEAQANHRHEALTGSLKEALQIREAQEINQARMFLRENEENIKSEAVQHVRAHEAQCKEKVEAYQRILDANLRQSMATKESEIERLRSQAAEKERVQEERIKRLEELVMQQSLHNQKLQSMLDSQLSQPPPIQVVETATLTRMAEPYVISAPIPGCTVDPPITSEHPFNDPFDVEVVPPPYAPPPMLAGPYASNADEATEDMVSGRIPAGGINITYCKQADNGSIPGPSHGVPLNNASGDQTPVSGRTVPYRGSGRKPSKGPNNGNNPGVTEMEDVEEGMREMMGMNMMVHLFHRHHQCPMSTRRRTRRRRQAMEGEEEMMILTRILMTVMRNLFDV